MFDDGKKKYDRNAEKAKKKLRDAWELFYTPMHLSHTKFRIKLDMKVKKGFYPEQ